MINKLPEACLIKLGGSLLRWSELPMLLPRIVAQYRYPVILVGGGSAADLVRDWDQRYQLGQEQAHTLAVHSMQLTATLLTKLSPEYHMCDSTERCHEYWQQGLIPVVDPVSWLEQLEPEATLSLPHTWEATSDSIALWLCYDLAIPELQLLKSIEKDHAKDWQEHAQAGQIDAEFPRLLEQMEQSPVIRWCCMKSMLPRTS